MNLYLDCGGSLFNKYLGKQALYYSMCLPSIPSSSTFRHVPQLSITDAILADHSTHFTPLSLGWKVFWNSWKSIVTEHTKCRKLRLTFNGLFYMLLLKLSTKRTSKHTCKRRLRLQMKEKEMSAFSFFTVVHLCSSHIINAACNYHYVSALCPN